MTTLETLTSFAERVETSAARREPIDWRRVFLALLSAVPYLLGKWVGYIAFGVRIMVAASREGYRSVGTDAAPTSSRRPRSVTMPTVGG